MVSRRHLSIRLGSASDPHYAGTRSKVYVTNYSSKETTVKGGGKLKENVETQLPNAPEVDLELQTLGHFCRFEWRDVIIGCSLSNTDGAPREQELSQLVAKVADMDIKVVTKVHPNMTHFINVSGKQTPKLLVSLVKAIPVVREDYLDALKEARNALERGFVSGFPRPEKHSVQLEFQVDHRRQTLFQGMSFFTVCKDQFNGVLDIISSAEGKAFHVEVGRRTTNVADAIIDFIQARASEKIVMLQPPFFFSGDSQQSGLCEAMVQACRRLNISMKNGRSLYNAVIQCTAAPLLDNTAPPPQEYDTLQVVDSPNPAEQPRAPKPKVTSRTKAANMGGAAAPASKQTTLDFMVSPRTEPSKYSKSAEQQHSPLPRRTGPIRRTRVALPKDDDNLFDPAPVEMDTPGMENYRKRRLANTNDTEEGRQSKVMRTAAPVEEVTRKVAPIEEAPPVAPTPPSAKSKRTSKAKVATPPPELEQDVGGDENDQEEAGEPSRSPQPELEEMDLEQLQNLVIVEDMPLQRPTCQSSPPLSHGTDYSNVPNFKRFKKSSVPIRRAKLEYAQADSDGINMADEMEAMYSAMSQRQSRLKHGRRDAWSQDESNNAEDDDDDSQRMGHRDKRMRVGDSDDEDMFVPEVLASDDDEQDDDDDLFVRGSRSRNPGVARASASPSQPRLQASPTKQQKFLPGKPKPHQQRLTTVDESDDDEAAFKFTT